MMVEATPKVLKVRKISSKTPTVISTAKPKESKKMPPKKAKKSFFVKKKVSEKFSPGDEEGMKMVVGDTEGEGEGEGEDGGVERGDRGGDKGGDGRGAMATSVIFSTLPLPLSRHGEVITPSFIPESHSLHSKHNSNNGDNGNDNGNDNDGNDNDDDGNDDDGNDDNENDDDESDDDNNVEMSVFDKAWMEYGNEENKNKNKNNNKNENENKNKEVNMKGTENDERNITNESKISYFKNSTTSPSLSSGDILEGKNHQNSDEKYPKKAMKKSPKFSSPTDNQFDNHRKEAAKIMKMRANETKYLEVYYYFFF